MKIFEKKTWKVLNALIIVIAILLGTLYAAGDEGDTIVSIDPSSQTVSAGDTFTINVSCVPGQPIKSFELELSFDPSLLTANSVTEGDIFDGYTTFFISGTIDNNAGTITDIYNLIVEPGSVSDFGTFVTISFTAKESSGISHLDLYDVGVTNETGYVPIEVNDGSVIILVSNNPPVFSDVTPSNESTGVSISTSTLSVTIEDPDGDTFNWTIETNPNIGSGSANNTNNGSKSCSISSLSYLTTYYWYVNATDGNTSTNETYRFTTEDEDTGNGDNGGGGNGGGGNGGSQNTRPTADVGGSYTGYSDQSIIFNGTDSSDSDGDTLTYSWDFGDGNTGTGATPAHTYNSTGVYNVTLTVSDGSLTDSDTTTANISELPAEKYLPVAAIKISGPTDDLLTFQDITFDGTDSYDFDGEIINYTLINYTWYFGDETIGYGVEQIHSYNISGLYNVSLSVKDNDGFIDSTTTKINIVLDSDNDGWSDEKEEMIGSDPTNKSEIIDIIINGVTCYLINIDADTQIDKFYNPEINISTTLEIRDDGKYLIDTDGNSKWDYVYDPASKAVTPYREKPTDEFPWLLVIIGIIIAIIVIIIILFLTGYIRIEEE